MTPIHSVTQTSTIITFSLCLHFGHRFEPFCQKILKYLSKAPSHKPAAKSQSYLFHCLLFCSNSPFFFQEPQNSTSHSCNAAFLCRCRSREYVFESRFCSLVWFLWSCCARGKKSVEELRESLTAFCYSRQMNKGVIMRAGGTFTLFI